MPKQPNTYAYLLNLYSRVDESLSSDTIEPEAMPELLVSFCIAVERILKIKLHKKNHALIFDTSKLKDDSSLGAVVLGIEKDIETVRIEQLLQRFKIVHSRTFSEEELQAILDLYEIRNCFIHGYKGENTIFFDLEDAVKKMGTVWEKMIPIAISLFGKNAIKHKQPKKKYTEEELEQVLVEQVKEKIKSNSSASNWIENYIVSREDLAASTYSFGGDKCPRCGTYTFSQNKTGLSDLFYYKRIHNYISNLYTCSTCHLELTPKEYDVAKKLM